jgi:hypothetical protein
LKYFIGIFGLVLVALLMTAHPRTNSTVDAQGKNTTNASDAVTGPPTLSAQFIDNVLCSAHSPACGTGATFYAGSVESGIDDAYALAFFQHESSFGLYGVARVNRGIGNIRCFGWQGVCLSGYRAYSSWAEGITDWYRLLVWYVTDLHKSSVETILATYAPSGDGNDTQAYINAVARSVTIWRQEQG